MNKSYKTVWNETTGTYVAASEVAKSRGKKSRNQNALVAAMLAAGVGFGTAVKAEAVDNLNQANSSTCVPSADGTQDPSNSKVCTIASQDTAPVSIGQTQTTSAAPSGQRGLLGATLLGVTPTSYMAMGTLSNTCNTNSGTYQDAAPVNLDATGNTTGSTLASIAIGGGAVTKGGYSIALGVQTVANGSGTAVGDTALAQTMATSIGFRAGYNGSGTNSVSLGIISAGSGKNATALGAEATASGANSTALGYGSQATLDNTVSVGNDETKRQIVNVAAGTHGTDVVNYAQLQAAGLTVDTDGNATNSFVAYDDTTKGTVTLGGGTTGTKLTNVAAGAVSASSTDAVNGAQLYKSAASMAAALGGGSSVSADGTVSAPAYSVGGSTVNSVGAAITNLDGRVTANATSIGSLQTTVTNISNGSGVANSAYVKVAGADNGKDNASVSTVSNAIAIGSNAIVKDDYPGSIAIGAGASTTAASYYGSMVLGAGATAASGMAIGYTSSASGGYSIALGRSAKAEDVSSVALGGDAYAKEGSVALGRNSVADVANTVSVGCSTLQRQIVNVAAGRQATDVVNYGQLQAAGLKTDTSGNATNSFVAYDDTTQGTVTFGGDTKGTKLANVAAGELSASSAEAVNGSQLYATNQNVEQNANAIAQNTTDIAQNASDISTNAGNIAQNTTDIATNASKIEQNTTDISTLSTQVGAINGAMTDVVKYDTSAHDTVTLAGTAGTTLSNVVAGTLSESSTEAVNGSQLYTTNQNVAQNTSDISTINNQIAALGGGVAGAVVYDTSAHDKVTLDGKAGTTLANVASGTLSESSTEAVNGSQLYATNQTVAENADAIAQNTTDIAANAAHIAQNTGDIAQNTSDIADLDTRVTTVEGSVSDLTNQINTGAVGLVQQDQTSHALTVASTTGGTSVDLTGTAGVRELRGVAAGTTSTSAVNVGQLSPFVAALGGGAQINEDGSITSPAYHMQGGTQTTVGDALDTLDTNLSSLETQINNGSIGVVTQDPTSRDILVGAATGGLRVNMAGTEGNRVVTGVAGGSVNALSSDAVNGSQLYANAASTAAALGGGSTVNEDGTISAPAYSVGGTTVNSVGAAIANVDGRVTQNTSDIANLQTTVGAMSGSVANALQYDTSAHNQVTLGGSSDAPKVKLTNLQDGELSATSTDAVTGAQLWNTNQQLSDLTQSVQNQQQTGSQAMSLNAGGAPAAAATGNNAMALGGGAQASGDNSVAIGSGSVADQANTVSVGSQGNERRITNVADGHAATDAVNMRQFQSGINDVARSAYSGVAAATALTMIPEVDPGKTLAVGVAAATYKGYQAAAVGASARITANVKVKVGAGISGSETTVGARASYQW
ncbi:YadA-like family protein [Paraburkholderia sediminicola]|uniref:YadA-like family protein n=1 Tax=Paraburkholderia sediminicola TaxID=458836 RepID=UPI0038BDBCD4